jgi:hypothetical protein
MRGGGGNAKDTISEEALPRDWIEWNHESQTETNHINLLKPESYLSISFLLLPGSV